MSDLRPQITIDLSVLPSWPLSMQKLTLLVSYFLVAACSSNIDNPRSGDVGATCPRALYIPYHEVYIETEDVLPEKIALEIEGEIKFDECLEQAVLPPPPIVHGERRKDGLAVVVKHYGAYKEVPVDVSFRVYDRKDCSSAAEVFFEATHVPLEFQKVYPAGPHCGSNSFAKTKVGK